MPPFRLGHGPLERIRQPTQDTAPRATSITPNSGRVGGGASVTISGVNFVSGATVTFDGNAATSVVVAADGVSLTCTSPSGTAGAIDVVITNPNGQYCTIAQGFTYLEGSITLVNPSRDLVVGGRNILITGVNFVDGSTIEFGGVAATGVQFVDERHFYCTDPARGVGIVDITITEPGGAVVTSKGAFTYSDSVFSDDIRRNPSVTIRQVLNNGDNRAMFTINGSGIPPVNGEKVIFTDLDNLLFAGQVQSVVMSVESLAENRVWSVTAIDYRFKLNAKRPFGTYNNVSVTDIVNDMAAKYAPQFSTSFVQTGLPRVSITFDGSMDFSTCLTTLAGLIGEGHWYIDYIPNIHFYMLASALGSSASPQAPLSPGPGTAMTASVSTTPALGYGLMAGYYVFQSSSIYNSVNAANPGSKTYTTVPGSVPVAAMAAVGYVQLSDQAAALNATSTVSNGRYCQAGSGPYWVPGWIMFDASGNYIAPSVAGQNQPAGGHLPPVAGDTMFASTDVAANLEKLSGAGVASSAAYIQQFESALSPISNAVFLDGTMLPQLDGIPVASDIGGQPATARRIYAIRLSDTHLGGGAPLQLFSVVQDNSTTTAVLYPGAGFSSTDTVSSVPAINTVNYPLGTINGPTAIESTTLVNTSAYLGRNAQPGWWAFVVTGVYQDGTESMASAASSPILFTGLYQATLQNIPTYPSIGSVPCVCRKVYASIYNPSLGVLDAQTFGYPNFGAATTSLVGIITDNLSSGPLTLPFGSSLSGGDRNPSNVPPNSGDQLGPNLEESTNPDDINDSNPNVLLNPPITVMYDSSQLRNRVYVKGKGSTLTNDVAVGDTQINIANAETFNPSGGKAIIGSLIVPYNALSTADGANALILASPMTQSIVQSDWSTGGGMPVLPFIQCDDLASQKLFGAIETDADGNPTDGIHEFTIDDNNLTNAAQMLNAGYSELQLFSRPIITITYSTRDPKTMAGKVVHVNLTNPPVTGDFVIQEVMIDQYHDQNDQLTPRYNVTADSAARFTLQDLLLSLSGPVAPAEGSVSGMVQVAVLQASSQNPVNWGTWSNINGSSTIVVSGPLFTSLGVTTTAGGSKATVLDTAAATPVGATMWQRLTGGVSTGADRKVEIIANQAFTYLDYLPTMSIRFRTNIGATGITSIRAWVYLATAALNNAVTHNTTPFIGAKYDAVTTSWYIASSDGVIETVGDMIAGSLTPDTSYRFAITVLSIKQFKVELFDIDDVLVGSATMPLPAGALQRLMFAGFTMYNSDGLTVPVLDFNMAYFTRV